MLRIALATFFSALSLALLLSIGAVAYAYLAWTMKERAYAAFQRELQDNPGQYRSARTYINVLLRPYIQESLQSIDPHLALIATPDSFSSLGLLHALEHLAQKQFSELLSQCEALINSKLPQNTQSTLIEQAQSLSSTADKAAVTRNRIETLLQKQRDTRATLLNNAADFADMLTLEPSVQADSESCPELYQDGVFQGLPTLKGIPDSIESLATVRELMVQLGGRSKITGPNAHQEFRERVDSISASSVAARQECDDLSQQVQELKAHEEELTTTINQLSDKMTQIVRSALLESTRPKQFEDFAKQYPPLRNLLKLFI